MMACVHIMIYLTSTQITQQFQEKTKVVLPVYNWNPRADVYTTLLNTILLYTVPVRIEH